MAWNHASAIVAMAVCIQPVAGVFTAPTIPDHLIAVSVPNNNFEAITADDPTATGTIWKSKRVYLGKSGTAGASLPLRGPGGAAPPLANIWPVGYILQAAGYSEVRNGAAIPAVFQAGSTTNTVVMAAGSNATDDFYVGLPIQFAAIGTGFRATTLISKYNGTTKTATVPETIVAPVAGDAYTIPPYLAYVLGTISSAAPPRLSVRIYRDKKIYDYKDWRPTSLTFDEAVTNEANTVFPSLDFSGKGTPAGVSDGTTPNLDTVLAVPVAPGRGGKFVMDRVKLGHQSTRFTLQIDVNAPSNRNADAGQDSYEITSGTRSIELDLDQMAVTDFDIESRIDNQTALAVLDTWGLGAGNRFGSLMPNVVLDPFSPGDRNGFVSLTGNAQMNVNDKSHGFAIWW